MMLCIYSSIINHLCISYMIHIIRTWTILDGYNDDSKRFKCIDSYISLTYIQLNVSRKHWFQMYSPSLRSAWSSVMIPKVTRSIFCKPHGVCWVKCLRFPPGIPAASWYYRKIVGWKSDRGYCRLIRCSIAVFAGMKATWLKQLGCLLQKVVCR